MQRQRPSLHGRTRRRDVKRRCSTPSAREHRGAVRADPGGPPPRGRRSTCRRRSPRGRAAAPPARTCSRKNEHLRGQPELPRRRLLAAPRAGGLRRDRRPHRVPDAGLGHARPPTTAATRPGSSSAASSASCSDMDFVGLPVYSWGCAAGHAIRMAARMTGRSEVLVPAPIDPERLSVIRNYCEPPEMASHIDVDARRLRPGDRPARSRRPAQRKLTPGPVAAVYFENPSLPRRDRARRRRDRRARPRARRRDDRRRRPDLARRAGAARPTTAPTSSSARCSRSAST